MDEAGIRLIIEGTDAAVAADEIKAIFQRELSGGAQGIEIRAKQDNGHDGNSKSLDPAIVAAVAGFVMTIPGAILSAVHLADRLKKKKELDRAFGETETKVILKKEVTMKIQYLDGTIKETTTLDTVEILERANP